MARSGSETRQRQITLKARFTEAEAALIRSRADRAGVSVAALIRFALLNERPLRASRRPSLRKQLGAQMLGKLGQIASLLRGVKPGAAPRETELIAAIQRDVADMRTALFKALGSRHDFERLTARRRQRSCHSLDEWL